MRKVNIESSVLDGLKDIKVPTKILNSVYGTCEGKQIKLDLGWQRNFAQENNLQRLEVLAAIEDMKRTGLLERLSMGVYRINQEYVASGKISFFI